MEVNHPKTLTEPEPNSNNARQLIREISKTEAIGAPFFKQSLKNRGALPSLAKPYNDLVAQKKNPLPEE